MQQIEQTKVTQQEICLLVCMPSAKPKGATVGFRVGDNIDGSIGVPEAGTIKCAYTSHQVPAMNLQQWMTSLSTSISATMFLFSSDAYRSLFENSIVTVLQQVSLDVFHWKASSHRSKNEVFAVQ